MNNLKENLGSRIGSTCWSHELEVVAGLPVAYDVGCRWVRSTWSLHFDLIRKDRHTYDFNADNGEPSIDRCLSCGLSVMGILDGRWGFEMDHNASPWSSPIWLHLDLWEEFVHRTVTHYRDRIKYWEIMNEPPFFWWYPTPEGANWQAADAPRKRAPVWGYADLLKSSARAIRAADPEARIIVGSGFNDGTFLRRLYELGRRDFFDIASVHYLKCQHPDNFKRGYNNIRSIMASFGDEAKPLWDTENGPGDAVIGYAVQTSAEYESLYNIYRHCLAHETGLDRYFWFNHPRVKTHDAAGRLTPAYQSLKTLTSLLGDGGLRKCAHLDNEVHLYVFNGRTGPVSILWATALARARVAGSAEAVTHLGEPVRLAGDFVLSGRPLLVHGDLAEQGFEAAVTGKRETFVACMKNKRDNPDAPKVTSYRVARQPHLDDPAWQKVPLVVKAGDAALVSQNHGSCRVSSSVQADLQMAHDDDNLYLRVLTRDERLDPVRPTGIVQFTLHDQNPEIGEWLYFYNSYALYTLYASPRGAMFLRFDSLLADAYPAGRVDGVKVIARPEAGGLRFWARIPWEELGPCRPGRHNPFYMMLTFSRADNHLDLPPGDTPEEWSNNFNDVFVVKPPAAAAWVTVE